MLGHKDINRIINGVREYYDLLEKSSMVMDRLAQTKREWDLLLSEREEIRTESERLNRFIAQFKEDVQSFHLRESRWVNSVADLNTHLQFLVDEINTTVGRHRRKTVERSGILS
jgi:predicted nuclease with TOPRIM domain